MTAGPAHRDALRAVRKRRLWFLLAATPLVLALVALGARFILLSVATSRAETAYADARYAEAARIYGSQTWLNIVDPWKVHYNQGTAQLQEGTPSTVDAAIDSLETSYAKTTSQSAEIQCLVQTNLALAYETAGDLRTADAETAETDRAALLTALDKRSRGDVYDQALIDTYRDRLGFDPTEKGLDNYVAAAIEDAKASYQLAIDARGRPGCPESTPQNQQQNEDATERVQDKLGEDDSENTEDENGGSDPSPSPSSPPSPSPSPSQDPEETERQDQLQEMNDRAQREGYEEQQDAEDTFGDSPGGRTDKKW